MWAQGTALGFAVCHEVVGPAYRSFESKARPLFQLPDSSLITEQSCQSVVQYSLFGVILYDEPFLPCDLPSKNKRVGTLCISSTSGNLEQNSRF